MPFLYKKIHAKNDSNETSIKSRRSKAWALADGMSLSFCSRWVAVFSPLTTISPPQWQQELCRHVLCFAYFFPCNINEQFITESFTSEMLHECAVNEGGEKCTAVFLKTFYLCQNERDGNGMYFYEQPQPCFSLSLLSIQLQKQKVNGYETKSNQKPIFILWPPVQLHMTSSSTINNEYITPLKS